MDNYHTVTWDAEREVFQLRFTDYSGELFRIQLTEDTVAQLFEDVADYYKRHPKKELWLDVIYVIEYCDIAGSGIEFVTTNKCEALHRWDEIVKSDRKNIKFIYSEHMDGVGHVVKHISK